MSDPFIGEIRLFGFNFVPRDWAQCNGQLLPIAQYTALLFTGPVSRIFTRGASENTIAQLCSSGRACRAVTWSMT